MAKMKLRGSGEVKPIIPLDINMLDAFIRYSLCDCVSKYQLTLLQRLVTEINIDAYQYDPDVYDRIRALRKICEGIIDTNITDINVLKMFISVKDQDLFTVLNGGDLARLKNTLNASECEFIGGLITERINCLAIYKYKDTIVDYCTKIENSYMTSYHDIVDGFKDTLSTLLTELNSTSLDNGPLREFSFDDPMFYDLVDIIVEKSNLPTSVLQTGIRQLNAILSPGFHSGRLYTFLGGTGKFKSGTLLNMADQIRRFNPQIKPFENGRRKTILFVTMENTIEETVVRLFDMYSDVNDEIYGKTTQDVIDVLQKFGNFTFSESSGIDITLRYYQDKEINTGDLYAVMRDCINMGKEPICLILDYIKRIESVRPNNGDERIRISNAIKELKSFSQYFNIPVITAMQLNREGNSIIDSALDGDNKQDVLRFVGPSNIGNCWDIMEETDWACIINLERKMSTNELFLTFKRVKIRYNKDNFVADYFNHPFSNVKGVRLLTDVDKDKSVSIASLASDLESVSKKETNEIINIRPKVARINDGTDGNSKARRTLQAIGLEAM